MTCPVIGSFLADAELVARRLNLTSSSSPIQRFVIAFHLRTPVSLPGYTARLDSLSRGCRNYLCDVSYITLRILVHLRDFSTWYARNRSVSSWDQHPSGLGI